ncbi:hypothetical protein WG66_010908 [Moniliophthora roreri]|nr:hypothetical protein WG66_010908 [Moniliophthora roreri]
MILPVSTEMQIHWLGYTNYQAIAPKVFPYSSPGFWDSLRSPIQKAAPEALLTLSAEADGFIPLPAYDVLIFRYGLAQVTWSRSYPEKTLRSDFEFGDSYLSPSSTSPFC